MKIHTEYEKNLLKTALLSSFCPTSKKQARLDEQKGCET